MDFLDDPDEMTPEKRLLEIAAVLALGYRRHLAHRATFTEKPLDCSGAPLPLCVEGLTAGEPTRTEVPE